ncbi:MAG: hypothetical protein IRZ16_19520 [Myxococcaceae bacterium]|nr:hypothetical protein [Myxococcaceae bacterium]
MKRLLGVCVLSLLMGCPAGTGESPDAGSPDADTPATDAGTDAGTPAPFTLTAFDNARITSKSGEPNFQKVETEIDWGTAPKEKVTLVVDLASTCYPFESWQQNPPPQGENWPADCDAFDRNFEFILDPRKEAGDPPGVELVRAITPFGGPEHFEIDLTDVANGLPGKHRLISTITTWSDASGQVTGSNGGWNVTARIDVVPGKAPRRVLAVIPLFNGSVTTPGQGPAIDFALPEGTLVSRLEYRVTGHGGGTGDSSCIGPAEEFCRREHVLSADGVELTRFTPWRNDCKNLCTLTHYSPPSGGAGFDYCLENPCGAIASVRAPRANWCPGSVTPAYAEEPAAWSTPGPHQFQWSIEQIADGGSWRLSAVVFAYGR